MGMKDTRLMITNLGGEVDMKLAKYQYYYNSLLLGTLLNTTTTW